MKSTTIIFLLTTIAGLIVGVLAGGSIPNILVGGVTGAAFGLVVKTAAYSRRRRRYLEARLRTIRTLGNVGDLGSISALSDLLTDDEDSVRSAAADMLVESDDPRVVESLVERISQAVNGEGMPWQAWGIPPVLGRIGDERAVPVLVSLVKQNRLSRASARALAWIGNDQALDALRWAIDNSDWQVKLAAIQGLGEKQTASARALLTYASNHSDELVASSAKEMLTKAHNPHANFGKKNTIGASDEIPIISPVRKRPLLRNIDTVVIYRNRENLDGRAYKLLLSGALAGILVIAAGVVPHFNPDLNWSWWIVLILILFGIGAVMLVWDGINALLTKSDNLWSVSGSPNLSEKRDAQFDREEWKWICHVSIGDVKVQIPKPIHDRIALVTPEFEVELIHWFVAGENVLHSIRVGVTCPR